MSPLRDNHDEKRYPWNPFNGPHKLAVIYYTAWAIIFASIAIMVLAK